MKISLGIGYGEGPEWEVPRSYLVAEAKRITRERWLETLIFSATAAAAILAFSYAVQDICQIPFFADEWASTAGWRPYICCSLLWLPILLPWLDSILSKYKVTEQGIIKNNKTFIPWKNTVLQGFNVEHGVEVCSLLVRERAIMKVPLPDNPERHREAKQIIRDSFQQQDVTPTLLKVSGIRTFVIVFGTALLSFLFMPLLYHFGGLHGILFALNVFTELCNSPIGFLLCPMLFLVGPGTWLALLCYFREALLSHNKGDLEGWAILSNILGFLLFVLGSHLTMAYFDTLYGN